MKEFKSLARKRIDLVAVQAAGRLRERAVGIVLIGRVKRQIIGAVILELRG